MNTGMARIKIYKVMYSKIVITRVLQMVALIIKYDYQKEWLPDRQMDREMLDKVISVNHSA